MFFRLRRRLNYSKFDSQTRGVLETPPIAYQDAPLAIVSMVSNLDPQMYIIAVKALYRRLGRGKIVAIVDADMPESKRALIRKHLVKVEFVHLEDINPGKCQRGGTWERVWYCVNRSAKEYVIQIDADTFCTGGIDEVLECVEANRAFTLSEGLPIRPLGEWAEIYKQKPGNHIVQTFEERAGEYPDRERLLYVRGSSGFAGFAKGGYDTARLEEFHEIMQGIHGERWKEWGTEQIASNYVAANSPDSLALPNPKYSTYMGGPLPEPSSLIHFIGTYRFKDGIFSGLCNREISQFS
ncbi:MAG: hypothetical protein IH602_07640 [Bryobacteraceae bacterium]|nr:hypothetical protein [Bryobacteraceae bacterium]